jgi:hypothetical protein
MQMRSGLICAVFGMVGASAFAQADLQGVWVSNIATPLQRPPALAGRATLTDAEVAELQKRADRIIADPNNDFLLGDAT